MELSSTRPDSPQSRKNLTGRLEVPISLIFALTYLAMKSIPNRPFGPETTENSSISPPSSSFHLILYNPGEASLHGKIKYLLDKEERSFQGLDLEVIRSFMEEKMPKNSEIGGSLQLVSPLLKAEPLAKDAYGIQIIKHGEEGMHLLQCTVDLEKIGSSTLNESAKVTLWVRKAHSGKAKKLLIQEEIQVERTKLEAIIPWKNRVSGTYWFNLRVEVFEENKSKLLCREANKMLAFISE